MYILEPWVLTTIIPLFGFSNIIYFRDLEDSFGLPKNYIINDYLSSIHLKIMVRTINVWFVLAIHQILENN